MLHHRMEVCVFLLTGENEYKVTMRLGAIAKHVHIEETNTNQINCKSVLPSARERGKER